MIDRYISNITMISDMLTQPSYGITNSAEEFGFVFAAGLVHDYYETALTFEADRYPAICSVAISIFKERFAQDSHKK